MKQWIIAAILLLPTAVWAGDEHQSSAWQLDQDRSTLNFVSIKKGSVGEVHHFDRISGNIVGDKATFRIDLSSVNTGIPIRNERMQKHLFDVSQFATATASLTVDPAWMAIKKGTMQRLEQGIQLSLHGVTTTMKASLLVIGMDDGLMVMTAKPIMLKASDFSFTDGIEKLRTLAKLPSIAQAIPVTVQLYFTRP